MSAGKKSSFMNQLLDFSLSKLLLRFKNNGMDLTDQEFLINGNGVRFHVEEMASYIVIIMLKCNVYTARDTGC